MPFTCIDWRINKYISISSLPITLNFFDESIHLNEPIHFLIQLLIRTEVPQKNICLGSITSKLCRTQETEHNAVFPIHLHTLIDNY